MGAVHVRKPIYTGENANYRFSNSRPTDLPSSQDLLHSDHSLHSSGSHVPCLPPSVNDNKYNNIVIHTCVILGARGAFVS